MKKIILIVLFFTIADISYSQVAFGKRSVTSGALVDFAQDSGKVVILPLVDTLPNNPSKGVLVVYKSDSTVYFRNDTSWVRFSPKGKLPTNYLTVTGTEKTQATIIGQRTSAAEGVLILESSSKALVLPKSNDIHLIPKPRIGSIAYDKVRKSVAIYNGKIWVYYN